MNSYAIVPSVTAVGSMPLRPVVELPARATIAEAARVLARSELSVVLLAGSHGRGIDTDAIVTAIALGASVDDPASGASVELVFTPVQAPLADTVMALARARRSWTVVIDDACQLVGVLELADAVRALDRGPEWLGALRVALHIENG